MLAVIALAAFAAAEDAPADKKVAKRGALLGYGAYDGYGLGYGYGGLGYGYAGIPVVKSVVAAPVVTKVAYPAAISYSSHYGGLGYGGYGGYGHGYYGHGLGYGGYYPSYYSGYGHDYYGSGWW